MKLCSVGQIEVKTDILSLIIFALLAYLGLLQQFFIIFIAFILHELSHVFVARECGLTVKSIRLTPFGGIAEIESFYAVGEKTEFFIAIAGPLMNITLAVIASAFVKYMIFYASWIDTFIYANAILAGINLIPALPLDGGCALRAILKKIFEEKRANAISIYISILIGAVFLIGAVYSAFYGIININAFVIGAFIIANAVKEKNHNAYTLARGIMAKRQRLGKQGYIGVMPMAAYKGERVSKIISNFSSVRYNVVAVLDDDMQLNGFIGEEDILQGAIEKGSQTTIGALSKSSFSTVDHERK